MVAKDRNDISWKLDDDSIYAHRKLLCKWKLSSRRIHGGL